MICIDGQTKFSSARKSYQINPKLSPGKHSESLQKSLKSSKASTRNKLHHTGSKRMITGNIGFTTLKSKLNSKYLNTKSPQKDHLFSSHHQMRRSLVDPKSEIPISPSNKNYKSNQDLEFYKTAPAYPGETISNTNQSSVESVGTHQEPHPKTHRTMLGRFKAKLGSGTPLPNPFLDTSKSRETDQN